MDFLSLIKEKDLDPDLRKIFEGFYREYLKTIKENGLDPLVHEQIFINYLRLAEEQIKNPHSFEPYHQMIRKPNDYHRSGLDFIRPLILFEKSSLRDDKVLDRINRQLMDGDNVIFFANHQSEADPQIISLLLEEKYPLIGNEMIFVAGHRVTTDPVAVPFSLGCNLLCIYSKKHVEHPPEEKERKLLHNRKTMHRMSELLGEGGKCIYMAPSGGRDRADETGDVAISPFDPASIEMFRLMAKQSGKPTHFYPLALVTYALLPPPPKIQKELGEPRLPKCTAVHLYFGDEINMDKIPEIEGLDRKALRLARCNYIFNEVEKLYHKLKDNE